jgi:predicted transcriptional regulator
MAMTERRILHIEISSAEEALGQFADIWHEAEQGDEIKPFYSVGFESMAELISTLTPKRWELIERLYRDGSMSIYALAKLLQRDYKNVYTDVRVLSELDIIQTTEDGKIMVPWDEVEAHFKLAA